MSSLISTIATVSNLTSGGSVVYKKNLSKQLRISKKLDYAPRKFVPSRSKFIQLFQYFKYVYIDLLIDYWNISKKININDKIDKVIVFQDSYLKAPYLLSFLNKKSIYILHEPPREFYEPMYLHAPTLKNRIFNFVARYPIKAIDKKLTQKADIIISNSEYSKLQIQKIYRKNSIRIYPGFGFKNVNYVKPTVRENACVSVGSLLPYKGHEEAIGLISKTVSKPKLTIIGNGSDVDKNRIQNYASNLGVNISIKSNLSDKEVLNVYQKSKIYLNCSYMEPFGLSALEAICCGCNLITNNTGGTRELKEFFDKNVIVASSDDDMVKKIDICLKKKNIIPRKIDSEFSWKNISNRVKSL